MIGGASPLSPALSFFPSRRFRLSERLQQANHPDSVAAVNSCFTPTLAGAVGWEPHDSSPLHELRWKGGSALLPINPQPDDQYMISVGRKLLIFLLTKHHLILCLILKQLQ